MLDFGIFEIRTDIFVLIVSVLCLLLQFFLCGKLKKTFVKLLPVILFSFIILIFLVLASVFDDWDRFGFLVLALCFAIPLAACGIGWGIWAIVKKQKTK